MYNPAYKKEGCFIRETWLKTLTKKGDKISNVYINYEISS